MKGDFTRNTFRPGRHYSGVLMQQGRVQLDADWNEQLDLAAHRTATEATDVIGAAGAPVHRAAFGIVDPASLDADTAKRLAEAEVLPLAAGSLLFSPGRFYAGGILCEADDYFSLARQPDFPGADAIIEAGQYLVYLDVWQRHLTALDDELIRESALGGPDTGTRRKTVWQVRTAKVAQARCIEDPADWAGIVKLGTGRLTARAEPGEETEKPCVLPPGAGYRRLENQLYRVEIHRPGEAGTATFKWSRDNGTVVTRLDGALSGREVKVEDLGRDAVLGFSAGDWVELLDDENELNGTPGVMAQIDLVERATRKVTFKAPPAFVCVAELNPKMRRWDDPDGARPVAVGPAGNDGFLELEDGVQVKFADVAGGAKAWYQTGDYWLIPARTASNNIEWAADAATGEPLPQAPQGIAHTYCCLATLTATGADADIVLSDVHDCRDLFAPLTEQEDGEEARRRHNRLLHGWGVVCGLQVHCGGDRQSVKIEPGCALQCDGSEALLPEPGRTFGVVAAARQADLLKNGSGRVALTMAADENRQISFGVRALAGDGSFLQTLLKGTLLMDFYQDCLKPVIEFVQKEFFTEDKADKRLANETVRRRAAGINLAVQFVNRTAGSHVLLARQDHDRLEQVYADFKKFLSDPVYCGALDGLGAFPDYPFADHGAATAFGKAPMTQVRVAPDGRAAYAFGGADDARVYVFDLLKAELAAEIELKAVEGMKLQVRDVAFPAQGSRLIVAATSGSDSVLYAFTVSKTGTFAPAGDPVALPQKQVVRLGQMAANDSVVFALLQGEGLARFSPDKFGAESFRPVVPFNATGQWVVGAGPGAGFILAGAAPAGPARTDRYTQLVTLSAGADQPAIVNTLALPAAGSDGFGVLYGTGDLRAVANFGNLATRLYVAVDAAPNTTAKRLLVLGAGGEPAATITLPTDGPVHLCPTADQRFLLVALAEEYLLGWIDPAQNVWNQELTLPTQMHPTALATTALAQRGAGTRAALKTPLVLVANRDSHTLSLLPAGLISPRPALTVAAMTAYRAELAALFREAGLRLLQQLKDCLCEHLRIPCPTCTENDALELAAVDIREGRVYHICNSRRREVITFPKLYYWLSAIPVLPALSLLVRQFCCLVLPDWFKDRKPSADLVSVKAVSSLRAQLTPARFSQVRADLASRTNVVTRQVLTATRIEAARPFRFDDRIQASQVLGSDVEAVKRRLAEQGVSVDSVSDYDESVAVNPWKQVGDLKLDVKPGERVNLLVRQGKVMLVTAPPASATPPPAANADLTREIDRLNGELTRMQEVHSTYIASREKQLTEMKLALDNFQSLVKTRVVTDRTIGGAAKTKKPK